FTTSMYLDLFLGTLVLLGYIFPITSLIIWLAKQWNVSFRFILLGILSGLFIPGWISANGNEYGEELLTSLFKNQEITAMWLSSFIAPLVEEIIKGIVVLLIIYLLNLKRIEIYFLIGIAVGFGFQISEDLSYLVIDMYNGYSTVSQAFIRLTGAFTSHWLLTCIMALGIYCFISKNKSPFRWLFIPFFLHFLWNCPLNEVEDISPIFSALISTWGIIEIMNCYFAVYKYKSTLTEKSSEHL
ncbi:PrsW family intramembrane metalloprotease, partial [Listeria monocytogenes]|nr:PrsW family intramembrane metalloprotease [Listeria monocytogenes]